MPRQWGTGDNKYERRTFKSIGAFSIYDFTNRLNARSRCFWYWISLPCEVVKETVLLSSSIVFNFCRVTRVPRQWGAGDNEYERRTLKSIGAFSIYDFTNRLNARSRCFWYWISLPCEFVKETVLLSSCIVFNFCRVTGSKKMFLMSMFQAFLYECFLQSFSKLISAKNVFSYFFWNRNPWWNAIQFLFVRSLPRICKLWYSFHDFLFIFFSFLYLRCLKITMLPDFGHSGSHIMSHIARISSKSFVLEDVVWNQRWYAPYFSNIPSSPPRK